MNPISPWLDPVELRRLAENLLAPANPVLTPPPSDAGFDSAFVGFASNPATTSTAPSSPTAPEDPLPVTADSASSLPERNTGVPPVTENRHSACPPVNEPTGETPILQDRRDACPPAEAQPEPRSLARNAFSERMQRFRDWLSHHFAATGVFVLDRNGGVIFDDSGHGRFHFLARSLATTSRQPGAPAGNVHVKIGTSGTLEVIPVETPFGWIILGAVVPDALPPAAVVVIIDALSQAAAPPRRTTA